MIVEPSIEEESNVVDTDSAWSLIACSSWLSGQRFELPAKQDMSAIKVGRGKDCDIIFPGTHLSREHVDIYIQDHGLLVKDLNSANGTYINDQRIRQGFLRPGDSLRLDVYTFKVEGPALSEAQAEAAEKQIELDFLQDITEMKLRDGSDIPTLTQNAADETDKSTPLKQWKTRPTSPGNRSEEEESSAGVGLKIAASLLLVVVIGLCAYLAFA